MEKRKIQIAVARGHERKRRLQYGQTKKQTQDLPRVTDTPKEKSVTVKPKVPSLSATE